MISFGNKAVTGMYYGDKAVTAAYYGDKLVWSGEEPRAVKFTALEDSGLSVQSYGSAPSITLEYSLDGRTWNPMTVDETVISVDAGDACYVRGVNNSTWATDGDNYNKFIAEGALKAEGPLVSLLDKDATSITQQRAMVWLFGDCTALKDIKGLTFPQDISFNCFGMMFNGSGISAAPDELPATALTADVYWGMFQNCSKLSDASNLVLKCT